LVIGGDGDELPRLVELAKRLNVESRVTFTGRLSEEALVDHLARCRAVVFVPKDEDFGFVTVEAFASAKAVITTPDSGGPAELARNGETGATPDPTPPSLAEASARFPASAAMAETAGQAAERSIRTMTWPDTIKKLGIGT